MTSTSSSLRARLVPLLPTAILGVPLCLFLVIRFGVFNPLSWVLIYLLPVAGPLLGIEWTFHNGLSTSFTLGLYGYTLICLGLLGSGVFLDTPVGDIALGAGGLLWYFGGWIFIFVAA